MNPDFGPLKGNRKGWFIRVIPSLPANKLCWLHAHLLAQSNQPDIAFLVSHVWRPFFVAPKPLFLGPN